MRSIALIVAGGLGVAASAHAQGRTIQLPDTLGANFAIADTARAGGSATDFDYLIGTWRFTFQSRRPDGVFNQAFQGHWYVEKKAAVSYTDDQQRQVQAVLVVDQWRPDDPSAPSSDGTYTFRAFNSQRPVWQIQGINVYSGQWEPGLAWGDASNRYLVQHYGTTIMRIRYFAITANDFLWRGDMSNDGGRTWLLDRWTMQASRIGR